MEETSPDLVLHRLVPGCRWNGGVWTPSWLLFYCCWCAFFSIHFSVLFCQDFSFAPIESSVLSCRNKSKKLFFAHFFELSPFSHSNGANGVSFFIWSFFPWEDVLFVFFVSFSDFFRLDELRRKHSVPFHPRSQQVVFLFHVTAGKRKGTKQRRKNRGKHEWNFLAYYHFFRQQNQLQNKKWTQQQTKNKIQQNKKMSDALFFSTKSHYHASSASCVCCVREKRRKDRRIMLWRERKGRKMKERKTIKKREFRKWADRKSVV